MAETVTAHGADFLHPPELAKPVQFRRADGRAASVRQHVESNRHGPRIGGIGALYGAARTHRLLVVLVGQTLSRDLQKHHLSGQAEAPGGSACPTWLC